MPQSLVVVKGPIKSRIKQMHVGSPREKRVVSDDVLFPPLRVQISSSDAELLA